MKSKYYIGIAVAVLAAVCLMVYTRGMHDHHGHEHGEGEHKSAHGGVLNAIVTCENGHAEVKVDGDVMRLWFVGGGSDTTRAVRVPESEIQLSVVPATGAEPRTLMLRAVPDALAEEKEGDCSHFEGKADWLEGLNAFVATAQVVFKGTRQELRIEYPDGYDPD